MNTTHIDYPVFFLSLNYRTKGTHVFDLSVTLKLLTMKKLLIILLAFFIFDFSPLFSQLKYTSDGKLGVGTTTPASLYSFGSVGDSDCSAYLYSSTSSVSNGLKVYHLPDNDVYNHGIISSVGYSQNGWKIAGIYCGAYRETNTDDIYTYGIRAYAGRGHNGLNYGVMGKLIGTRNGTGIFGCDSEHAEISLPGDYAGYFRGDVHIDGDLTVNGTYPSSDINLKKDIRIIEEDVISKIQQLRPIRFKQKHYSELDEFNDTVDITLIAKELESDRYTKDRIGLIAQELQTTFPEVVKEGNDGYLRVDYDQLIPVLIKAIKQQQQQIESLESMLYVQKSTSESQGIISTDESSLNFESTSKLEQNVPNPFYENTIIGYYVHSIESNAMVNIYNVQGAHILSLIHI